MGRNRKLNQSVDLARLESLCRKQGPLALQREGRIRELHNLTDLKEGDIEGEILNTVKRGKKREVELIDRAEEIKRGEII